MSRSADTAGWMFRAPDLAPWLSCLLIRLRFPLPGYKKHTEQVHSQSRRKYQYPVIFMTMFFSHSASFPAYPQGPWRSPRSVLCPRTLFSIKKARDRHPFSRRLPPAVIPVFLVLLHQREPHQRTPKRRLGPGDIRLRTVLRKPPLGTDPGFIGPGPIDLLRPFTDLR